MLLDPNTLHRTFSSANIRLGRFISLDGTKSVVDNKLQLTRLLIKNYHPKKQ